MAPFGASRAGLMSTRVDAIPDSGANHRWDMDADPVPDQIGSLDLTLNGPSVEDDNRISLDGVDDDGTINDPLTDLVTGGNDGGGVGVWFRVDNLSDLMALWSNSDLAGDSRFLFAVRPESDGGLTFFDNSDRRESGWEPENTTTWYFGVVRWDPSDNGELLIDGDIKHTEGFDFGSNTNTDDLGISNFRDDMYFEGEIGISWIWLEEPSDSQLADAFDSTKGIYK